MGLGKCVCCLFYFPLDIFFPEIIQFLAESHYAERYCHFTAGVSVILFSMVVGPAVCGVGSVACVGGPRPTD